MFTPEASRMEYIFGLRPMYSAMGLPSHSSFILPNTFLLVWLWREGWVLKVARRVIEALMLGHVLVDVLRLDLEEEAVCIGIEQITPISVLALHLVVVEVIHQMLLEVQDTHSHIDGPVEHQAVLMHVDARQVVVEYVGELQMLDWQ